MAKRSLYVESPGLLTTVQDLGRDGFGPLGISPSGAADPISLRLGNHLTGNPEGAPGLEMTLVGGAFRFPQGATIAITGSDFAPALDGAPVDLWTSCLVAPGQLLQFGASRSGARCYLSIAGGISVAPWLGSASTHLLCGLGGLEGRPLRKGDLLTIGSAEVPFRKRLLDSQALTLLPFRKLLRVTPGPQSELFSESEHRRFYDTGYSVTEQSNRMGIRLHGSPLDSAIRGSMITEGVSLGAVQVPPSGQPIILFVEQQTTGGYPKIANVVAADLPSLGQLRPRDQIRFERVDFASALRLLETQENLLAGNSRVFE